MKKFFYFILFIIVIAAIFGAYVGSIIFVKDLRSGRAQTMAHNYVSSLYSEYSVIGENCQGEDTNSDSYVSCDIRIQIGGDISTQKVLNLNCPTMWKSYTGNTCKERSLGIVSE